MNTPILNRDFAHPADGWYNIEARGEHPAGGAWKGKLIQVIDDAAATSIVNRFNAQAAKPGYAGMLIDHEHFKHDGDKETRAYGWVTKLQNRPDGIYAQIRWTATGQEAVDGGDYRFFSTEYDPKDLEIVNSGKPKKVRPLALDGLTLTNVNNNKGQKPITNRMETDTSEKEIPEGAGATALKASKKANDASENADTAPQHEQAAVLHRKAEKAQRAAGHDTTADYHADMSDNHDNTADKIRGCQNRDLPNGGNTATRSGAQTQNTETMKTVLTALGLREDASEQDALSAVKKIQNRNTELETSSLDADLETYKNRFDPAQKDFVKSMLVTNRATAIEFLKTQPEREEKTAPGKVHNRANIKLNKVVNKDAGGDGNDADNAAVIQNRVSELRAGNPRLTYDQARNQVRRSSPELFGLPARGK